MRKVAKIIGYTILGIFAFVCIIFTSLFFRYETQSDQIHTAVNSFVHEMTVPNSKILPSLTHPQFYPDLVKLLNENQQSFLNVDHVSEQKYYFSYHAATGGETTEYKGDIFFKGGPTENIVLKLIKKDGAWVVYGIEIQNK